MQNDHFERLQQMYLNANINQRHYPSTTCVIAAGRAEISLEIGPDYFHALGATHGSVYFKLLDDAAFFAAQAMVTDYFILTTHFELDLLRPVEHGKITARGNFIAFEGNAISAMATLYNHADKCIGKGIGIFKRSKKALNEVAGYMAKD